MSRNKKLVEFLEFDQKKNYLIEPSARHASIRGKVLDIIKEYNPSVIIKAGVGSGVILYEIARECESYIVVIEPSLNLIREFREKHKGEDFLKRTHFINGFYEDLPVDYYKADMVICVDSLHIIDSSRCLDEFRRALQFEGILFLGTVVLNNEDIDGVYDELIHLLFPLHNDYYLEDDLKTFLELKDFRFVKGTLLNFPRELSADMVYFKEYTGTDPVGMVTDFMKERRDVLTSLYSLNDRDVVEERYFVGYFARKKPEA